MALIQLRIVDTQLIKTTVNISCGLLNEILTFFIFLLRFLYVTLSYK